MNIPTNQDLGPFVKINSNGDKTRAAFVLHVKINKTQEKDNSEGDLHQLLVTVRNLYDMRPVVIPAFKEPVKLEKARELYEEIEEVIDESTKW